MGYVNVYVIIGFAPGIGVFLDEPTVAEVYQDEEYARLRLDHLNDWYVRQGMKPAYTLHGSKAFDCKVYG